MAPSLPPFRPDDWLRIRDALRYVGRDLHHRSFAVADHRRPLLWEEMDRCLQLADRIEAAYLSSAAEGHRVEGALESVAAADPAVDPNAASPPAGAHPHQVGGAAGETPRDGAVQASGEGPGGGAGDSIKGGRETGGTGGTPAS